MKLITHTEHIRIFSFLYCPSVYSPTLEVHAPLEQLHLVFEIKLPNQLWGGGLPLRVQNTEEKTAPPFTYLPHKRTVHMNLQTLQAITKSAQPVK